MHHRLSDMVCPSLVLLRTCLDNLAWFGSCALEYAGFSTTESQRIQRSQFVPRAHHSAINTNNRSFYDAEIWHHHNIAVLINFKTNNQPRSHHVPSILRRTASCCSQCFRTFASCLQDRFCKFPCVGWWVLVKKSLDWIPWNDSWAGVLANGMLY